MFLCQKIFSRIFVTKIAFILLWSLPVFADDNWTTPYSGVRHLSRTTNYDYSGDFQYKAHILIIDLTNPAVSLHATPADQPGGTVSDFAERNQLEVAWNTNFFSNSTTSCGTMMGAGSQWTSVYNECQSSLGVGAENEVDIFVQTDPFASPPHSWMQEVITGLPGPIVVDGQPAFSYGCGNSCAYHPRTGIGYNQSRTELIVVIVDGRSEQSVGAGLDDLGNLLVEFGAWTAINLDGGGSTALFINSEGGVVNHPSDGSERNVCCHMGLNIQPDRQWYSAQLVEQSPDPVLEEGERSQLTATFRNLGRKSWHPAGDFPVRLGTWNDSDRSSIFAIENWIAPNRPASFDRNILPGETGQIIFAVQSSDSGIFTESFSLVAENARWMSEGAVTWTLTVTELIVEPEPELEPDNDETEESIEVSPEVSEDDISPDIDEVADPDSVDLVDDPQDINPDTGTVADPDSVDLIDDPPIDSDLVTHPDEAEDVNHMDEPESVSDAFDSSISDPEPEEEAPKGRVQIKSGCQIGPLLYSDFVSFFMIIGLGLLCLITKKRR